RGTGGTLPGAVRPSLRCLGGVLAGQGGVAAAGGGDPGHDAGAGLGEGPAFGLLAPMAPAAGGAQVAFAGDAAVVVRDGVVEVAAGGGAAAAGPGAGDGAGPDEALQGGGGPVAGFGVAVSAGPGGDGLGGDAERPAAARPADARLAVFWLA